ncbi:bifunctional ATP-dependent DNA helicase/ssDNA endodeoxyribonuclease DNA2 [Aspergillus clavatus NRRL 1]|uniref:DNA replication ATP-dependent helicase/nuclease n=1 Tax=Aspergillus clavatus (strain ATCC 1007 / CBS 513.65 / DSM 816 / NCTC 3887 / NRRL 1 / QM 1276 / 107) TaxID=344612 RepID=A1CIE5_ASPCL|nr:DNA replication helicase Dna2, putative [Aspergillus clavatus NRRL 1]EAW10650.1 DNA replication helicase Dna2, putative [Aspergillus clavatus NRRL 1]
MAGTSKTYPISSNSRTKLNAFRYSIRDGQVEEKYSATSPSKASHGDKENQTSWLNGVVKEIEPLASEEQPLTEAGQSKSVRECPQTPGNRIPLADLISNAEDAFNRAPVQEFTPEDHVIWQHVPASSNPNTLSQASANRGRKRRHSSSPTSSPLGKGLKRERKRSFDMQSFQALLKTPQNDLATDLWNNYVGKASLNGEESLPPPRFANLLSSSPQTPVSAGISRDSSGLRRSISCNAEWPTSKAKRRKVNGQEFGSGRNLFTRSKSNILDSGDSKTSRLNFLLQKIENSLQKPSVIPVDTSDLSPVPKRKHVRWSQTNSPFPRKAATCGPEEQCDEHDDEICPTIPKEGSNKMERNEVSSSDFGDDDLDQDFLELAEASADPFIDSSRPGGSTNSPKRNLRTEPILEEPQNLSQTKEEPHQTAQAPGSSACTTNFRKTTDHDDFDDDFDDIEDILAECDENSSLSNLEHLASTKQSTWRQSGEKASMRQSNLTESYQATNGQLEISSGDEFDDDDFDVEAIEQSMQPGKNESANNLRNRQAIKRYLIVDVAETTYSTQKGRIQPEKVLLVQDEKAKQKKVILLRESWFDSPCSKDAYIHLIGDFDPTGQCVVDDSHNMIVLHPDHLVSATVVADSISCQRRAVLQDRIKNSSDISKPQVFGNIFHELFQEAMKLNKWDLPSLKALVEAILIKHVEDLYLIDMSVPAAVEYMMSRIPALRAWAEIFLRKTPSAQSLVEDRHSSKVRLSINKLLEVEEHIWSPMYGLKGNIDATVQVACHDGEGSRNLVIPLELKTGNRDTNQAHRAQTALYTLLLSDRYDVEVTFGLLYYLEISKIFRIRGVRHELLQMIQERNRLAGYVRERHLLPPMVKKPGMCSRCYSKTPCFIYHKLVDDGDGETSGLGDEFVKAMDHLHPQHQSFFRKWDDLLTKEEQSMMRFRRELWTLLSSEREALGRCFGNVVIQPGSAHEDKDSIKINRYRYTFMKKQSSPSFSFTESQLTVGEPIVISDEKGHFALANGYVVQVSPKHIMVAVDRRLHNARTKMKDFDAAKNQSFRGIMEIVEGGAPPRSSADEQEEEILYRLDKDEFSNGMAIVRNNLISMMEKDVFQASRLRRLIVEGEAPVFNSKASDSLMSDSDKESLNVDQKRAIEKVMSARDYALVLGMPGTGKTTTIAHIIRALVAQGKSVLLTSYTHTAVDNILLKIRNDNIRILRVGATAKVHPEVQQFVDLAAIPKTTIEELKASYEESQVVATTCLGVNHNIFNRRIFDYCIVDEASQITLPVCLGPIRMARTFILVGDHYQLPPLVQNKEAQDGGLDVSLFKLLSDAHPESVVNLEHQYRMSEDIMLLSNTLIYSGRLKCGTHEVASRSLKIPNMAGLKLYHINQLPQSPHQRQFCLGTSQGRCWLRDLLDPSAKNRFINTDTLEIPARDMANGARIVNSAESTLCSHLVEALISCGIPARKIGVITFYRSQLSLLKQTLRRYLPELEMHTADKFQGRDKEIVILSCVRSNADNNVGDLLRDWRRINVAFTRARTKLLVIGSKSTLRNGNELLGKYINLMEKQRWVYDLPKDALENHTFDCDAGLSQLQDAEQSISSIPAENPKTVSERKASRNPLSPTQARQNPQGLKKPAKRGAKLLSGTKILGNRPVLQDVMNDLFAWLYLSQGVGMVVRENWH